MNLATLPLRYKFLLVLAGMLCLSFIGVGGGQSGAWPLAQNWGQPGNNTPPREGRRMNLGECGDGAGLNTGNPHDYAGLIVEMRWNYANEGGGNLRNAGGDAQAVVRNYNGQSDSGGNIYNSNTGARYMSGAFDLKHACGRDSVAVLGYNHSSTRGGQAGPWTLDCDESLHGGSTGQNGQDFEVTGQGVPSGALRGGSWETKYVRSDNGFTTIVQIVYHSPLPPPQGCQGTCCASGGCPTPKKWELDVTTHVRKPGDSQWVTIMTAQPGQAIEWRHGYSNYGDETANANAYERKRQYSYAEAGTTGPVNGWWNGNTYTGLTLSPDQERTETIGFTIPANAPLGTKYCQRDTVSPGQKGGTGTRYSSGACVTVVSWSLDAKTYVSTDGANWSLGPLPVEQGTTRLYFMSTIKNNGNVWANFDRTREYSHSTTNPGNPWNQTDQLTRLANNSPSLAPGATWQSSVRAVNIPADAPLTGTATQWCERYVATPGTINGGQAISNAACAGVVGGKTSLSMLGDNQTIEPYESIQPLKADLSTSQFTPFAGWTGYTIGCNYTIAVVEGGSAPPSGSGSCDQFIGANGTVNARTFPYQATPADVGKRICLTVTISATRDNFLGPVRSGQACFRVVVRPYMKVQSGDVTAGNGFIGGNCINGNASIAGWNKNNSPGYWGAGATLAVLAQNTIQGFVSGQGLKVVEGKFGYAPTNLSFANTANVVLSQAKYGGSFGSGSCVPDYYGNRPSTAQASWPGLNFANDDPSNQQDYSVTSNNLSLTGGTIRHGSNIRLYVKGNVYINNNIVTDSAGGPVLSVPSIPNFTLVVQGNIYIAPNVSQLYGTYIAQPTSEGSGGNIYTCATNGLVPCNLLSTAQWYSNGSQAQLVVTGSLTAKKVNFLRTRGSLYLDNGGNTAGTSGYDNAAEIIRYNPLTGLRQSTDEDTASSSTYDSITTLPPIL